MKLKSPAILLLALAATFPVIAAAQAPAETSSAKNIHAITRPSGDVTLTFVRPGKITEMMADLGDPVKAQQIVAKQDDSEEIKMLESAKAEADDNTEIEAERAVLEKDKVEKQKLDESNSTSPFERREAALKVTVDEARIKLAIFKKKQAEYKYEASKAGIEKFKLVSPIDGVVAQKMIHVGEVTDGQNTKVMRIVQVDPLWVEVPVPIAQARLLKQKDPAQITFSDKKIREGKVAVVYPVGDSASRTILVRVEVPNPEKLQSGENVLVTFGPPSAVAGAPANP